MCGIAGIFNRASGRPADPGVLRRMRETLWHRGPDDGGEHLDGNLGIAHRRLSIIDLGGGHQPLFNGDRTVAVVFNGEIYNYRELAMELVGAGHVFHTRSDTEVLVHGYEHWGEGMLERLRGMFAFALWDARDRSLLLARDRLGIKPLYYAVLPGGDLLFGSELKAITVNPAFPRALQPEAIEEYFAYGYIPEPRSVYRHAFKLPPGHCLRVHAGAPVAESRHYWDLTFQPDATLTFEDAAEALPGVLREAVAGHLASDVPVGAFLSGGVDSSAVVALMAELEGTPVHTASISFGEREFDEARYARCVAAQYATRHHEQRVAADDFGLVEPLAGLYDEPFADSSAMPTYRVCELARRHVKVVLSGDGGDETFAGYRRYAWYCREERVRSQLPIGLRRPFFGLLGRLYPKLDWAPRVLRARATFEALALDPVEGYFHSVSLVGAPQAQALFTPAFRRELGGYRAIEVLRRHARHAPEDPLSRVQYLDFKTYLPGDILTKVDRASMAHSLEVRVPVLDHRFVEWAAMLPPGLKWRRGEGKAVFKHAMASRLPHELLYRPKMGFAVPLATWFRDPLRERVHAALLGDVLGDTGWFSRHYLSHVVTEHDAGRRDYSALIWSLLMLEQVLRREGAMAPASPAAAVGA
ncbi:XrtA/PEP-CTERM system amidotransferase [Arhodomonas sp. SL1]|uniref:XrtA/PEP-CTERM system amidotransferase n=1 Tax=Arhodomonas sp. SL1 TaxID=3425691 RepID=UPI003F8829B0